MNLFYQACVCWNNVGYQLSVSAEPQILGGKSLAVEDPIGYLAARQPQCIHRNEEEKNAGREEKAQREEKFTGVALYQQSLFALLPCSTSKLCAEICSSPWKDSFRAPHPEREIGKPRRLITADNREFEKPGVARTPQWPHHRCMDCFLLLPPHHCPQQMTCVKSSHHLSCALLPFAVRSHSRVGKIPFSWWEKWEKCWSVLQV